MWAPAAARLILAISFLLPLTTGAAEAQDWDTRPSTGEGGPYDGSGPDGVPGNADDFDGVNNTPDLTGPDGQPGTADDLQIYIFGTASGNAGCFTNNQTNCAGAAGAKSAEWSIRQVPDLDNCLIETTLTNTSDGEPGCPEVGCITAEWHSPGLPNLEAAVRAALDIPPMASVSAVDGPGPGASCRLGRTTYRMGWNPDTDNEPVIELSTESRLGLWALVLGVAVLALLGFIFLRRRPRGPDARTAEGIG